MEAYWLKSKCDFHLLGRKIMKNILQAYLGQNVCTFQLPINISLPVIYNNFWPFWIFKEQVEIIIVVT